MGCGLATELVERRGRAARRCGRERVVQVRCLGRGVSHMASRFSSATGLPSRAIAKSAPWWWVDGRWSMVVHDGWCWMDDRRPQARSLRDHRQGLRMGVAPPGLSVGVDPGTSTIGSPGGATPSRRRACEKM